MARYELAHFVKTKELRAILEEFDCRNGKKNDDFGTLIVANSWGSGKAHKLAKMYHKACGEQVDSFYIIDGISKSISAFRKDIPAKQCFNYLLL